jgi:type IV pilus assembly protein PilA
MTRTRRGFTLVELMVVVVIVGILAAVALPLMTGRSDASKWSEAKTTMGVIASALRAYTIEKANFSGAPSMAELGIRDSDLDGTYFSHEAYVITSASTAGGPISYVITCTAADSTRDGVPANPPVMTLTCNSDNSYTATFTQQGG